MTVIDVSSLPLNGNIEHVRSDRNCHTFRMPSNGMRFVWLPVQQGQQVVVQRLIDSGSRLENVNELGAAHALEHFLFKDGYAWSNFAGCNINASTSNNYVTTLYEGPLSLLPKYLRFQANSMRGKHIANVTQKQLHVEIDNVLDEMHRNQAPSAAARHVIQTLNKHVINSGNVEPTIGLESTLKSLTLDRLIQMHKNLLGPSRQTLLVVGGLPEGMRADEFVNMVGDTFNDIPCNEHLHEMPSVNPRTTCGMRMVEMRRPSGASLVGLGWPSPAYSPQSDVLEVVRELMSPRNENAPSVLSELKDVGLVSQCFMHVNRYTRPDSMYLLAAVPCSTETEDMRVMMAQSGIMAGIGKVLMNFNDESMLQSAVENVRNGMRKDTQGDLSRVADVAAAGIMACDDASLDFKFDDRFADGKITCQDVRAAARGLLSENDLVLVRHLQNTIPPRSKLPLSPITSHLRPADNGTSFRLSEGACLSTDSIQQLPDGVLVTHSVRPHNRAFVTLAVPVPGIRDQWASQKLVPELFECCGLRNKEMMARNISCNWSYSDGHIVSNLSCDHEDLGHAVQMWTSTLRDSTFDADKYEVQRGKLSAITNGSVFDADLRSKTAVYNQLYESDDVNYITPVDARKASIRLAADPRVVQQFLNDLQHAPVRVATINVTPESRASIVTYVSPPHSSPLPPSRGYARTARLMRPTSRRINVPGTPSCNVCIGQRFLNAMPDDVERLAKLKLATLTMGNSFTGKLMKIVRDQEGLTYGISAKVVSNGSYPSMVVTATFNKNVLSRGHSLTMKLLDGFAAGRFTAEELEVARNSMRNSFATYGTTNSFLQRAATNALLQPSTTDFSKYWRTVEACSFKDIQQLVRGSLKPGAFAVATAGTLS